MKPDAKLLAQGKRKKEYVMKFPTSSKKAIDLEQNPLEKGFRRAVRGTAPFVKEGGLESTDKRHKALAEYLISAYKADLLVDADNVNYISVAEQKTLHRKVNPDNWQKNAKGNWILKKDPKTVSADKLTVGELQANVLATMMEVLGRALTFNEVGDVTTCKKRGELIAMHNKYFAMKQAAEQQNNEQPKAE